jgi:phosphoenolpyruvate carboxykinase (diphosphate)
MTHEPAGHKPGELGSTLNGHPSRGAPQRCASFARIAAPFDAYPAASGGNRKKSTAPLLAGFFLANAIARRERGCLSGTIRGRSRLPPMPSMPSHSSQHSATASFDADEQLIAYLNLKLREIGQPGVAAPAGDRLAPLMDHFLALSREKDRALARHLCPVDQRIQHFLQRRLGAFGNVPQLPTPTLVLDRPGLARVVSLPPDQDRYENPILTSHRVRQGVIHNPRADRRTTHGIFHVTEFGPGVPDDKKGVPSAVFSRLLRHALTPPPELLQLPFTSTAPRPAECFVTLYLRPTVCPAVPGFTSRRSMETRFFIPGSLVANIDFVERIFGNAGDPHLPDNDAALDPEHWTGHTGCVILATHLTQLTKQELGLPAWADATARQRHDGMCWKDPGERYNDGSAFKVTARDESGVVVTLIADNYFGYCKKEVKTQISFAANLLGRVEEEHAGGALVFPSYDLGEDFQLGGPLGAINHTFAETVARLGDGIDPQPGGWARDRTYPDICYIPHDAVFDLRAQTITWSLEARAARPETNPDAHGTPALPSRHTLKLLPRHTYLLPSGYKIEMIKPDEGRRWRLRGTTAEGILCHKPCTVSGGGKSEISKSIADAMFIGPNFVSDFVADFDLVDAILRREYGERFRDPARNRPNGRPLLSPQRSLGSVVKLLSRSPDYTDVYNAWLDAIPHHVRDIVLLVKRYYKPEWGDDWRRHFSVDTINGRPGNEVKYHRQKVLTHYLRVGFTRDGSWRTFSLRKDFFPAVKIQAEDDITASIVVPRALLTGLPAGANAPALKFVQNCETHLFQRPDEAIVRGYDKHTERDFSRHGNFFSNYEPLDRAATRTIVEDAIGFDAFTEPIRAMFGAFNASSRPDYLASPAHPRLVDGKPSKNPRYLQHRPDLEDPRATYLAQVGARLYRRVPAGAAALFPVDAVLSGRRLNPPEPGVRPLCVFGPLHYQELPEAFMDFISSLTGKSPSTTGAGSEGALTKGPFNALPPIHDLNAAVVAFILTDLAAFSSAAGWVGPRYRVDHDISLLVPEIWARMSAEERTPRFLIEHGYLERCTDFEYEGSPVLASRLGWRITARFVQAFCGRVLSDPSTLFAEELLRPELQDPAVFADGVDNIVQAMRTAAQCYFSDGSIEQAVPPLRALLHLMRDGTWEGRDATTPAFRALFTRECLLASDWYRDRLEAQQVRDIAHWEARATYLKATIARENYADVTARLRLGERLAFAAARADAAREPGYLQSLQGTLGVDPALLGPTRTPSGHRRESLQASAS